MYTKTLREQRNSKRLDRTITPWRKAMIHNISNNEEKWLLRKLGPAILLIAQNYQKSNLAWIEWLETTYGYEKT